MSDGMIPGAPPTAPGGMKLSALKVELVEKHGYKMADLRDIKWGAIIDMVIAERINRETEQNARDLAAPQYPCDDDADLSIEDMFDDTGDAVDQEYADDESGSLSRLAEQIDLSDYAEEFIAQDHDEPDDVLDDIVRDTVITARERNIAEAIARPVDMAVLMGDDESDDLDDFIASMESHREEHLASIPEPPSLFIGMPHTRDYIFDNHAGAGPSGAERWMNCTMSLGASRAFLETLTPNQQHAFAGGSGAARQGTTAHAVGEVRVREALGEVSSDEVDATLMELAMLPEDAGEAYDTEMGEHLDSYVDLVKTYIDSGRTVLVEARVEAAIPLTQSGLVEDDYHVITGSGDVVVLPIESEPVLTVGDLKYGDGIDVSVEANPQVRLYALGALALCALDDGSLPEWLTDVEYVICQPRLGGIKVWTESVNDLLDWRDDVLSPALTAALGGPAYGATYSPSSETCQWCPAQGACPALAEQRMAQAVDLFDAVLDDELVNETQIGLLADARLGDLLTQIMALDGIKDSLKAEAQRRLHRGQQVPGFRLVSYTPPRSWKAGADTKVREVLGSKTAATLFKDPSLRTPTQAIALLGDGAKKIEALIETPDKRPVISTGPNDKRKDWAGLEPEAMFQIEED